MIRWWAVAVNWFERERPVPLPSGFDRHNARDYDWLRRRLQVHEERTENDNGSRVVVHSRTVLAYPRVIGSVRRATPRRPEE